jgi:NAD(P)-dependent dehydrogenase (short-subunit alcohol dehydrogenase family)
LSEEASPARPLEGRVYLVSGAASGIGRATAVALAEAGSRVVLLDRMVEDLEKLYDEVEDRQVQPAIFPVDFEGAGPDDYAELAQAVRDQFGRIDGIVHSAARLGPLSPVEDYPPDEWAKVLQVDLNAPYMLTRACLADLRQGDDPCVIFLSDAVGRQPYAYWGAYGVAKAGLESLAGILSQELEQWGGRVYSVDPGPVATQLRREAFPGEAAEAGREPEEVAAWLLRLASESAAFASGARLAPGDFGT